VCGENLNRASSVDGAGMRGNLLAQGGLLLDEGQSLLVVAVARFGVGVSVLVFDEVGQQLVHTPLTLC
jgi:hypothetical protein